MSNLPPEVARRRRLVTRLAPLSVVAAVAFIFGAVAGVPGSPERDAASRFVEAWEGKDFSAMYGELNEESRRQVAKAEFVKAYRDAAETATLRSISGDDPGDTEQRGAAKVVPVPVIARTVAFGTVEEELGVPYEDGGIAWDPSLAFPGLRRGEHLESRVELAPRAPILAADGEPLAEGPAEAREHPLGSAMIDVTGEIGMAEEDEEAAMARRGFPPGTPVGISGVEQAFNSRLAGRPGGTLLAVADNGGSARIIARAAPKPGAPVKTTIDPDLQSESVTALAGRAGGVAVLDPDSGDVRALAGQAFSAPQPPGSTFKMLTTIAALQKGVVSLDDNFEISNGANVGGRFISNANGEYCGGSFREAFAESCNADFAPLGPKIGNDDFVAAAERFGFNSPPSLYNDEVLEEIEPEEPTIPTDIGEEVDLGVTAIGQGEVLATPLMMASIAQAIANDGVLEPTSLVMNQKLRPEKKPVRVMSKKIAGELTELMIGVVTEGTGFAGAIPEGQVAGKTGTAELGPVPGQENSPEPEQIKDAWFAAFAPAEAPKLVVGVLLIEAEAAGGEVAAPIASQVLSSGL
ncbi:MAG TPA: penicillin-binding transpeptidase domain-containing protein [Solirubrobacterales bacterium]